MSLVKCTARDLLGQITQRTMSPEGFLIAPGAIARAGNIQEYRASELGFDVTHGMDSDHIVRLYRPTSEVHAPETIKSFEGQTLTVQVIKDGDGLPLPGTQVNVLQTGTLTSVVTGTLNPALEFASNVPAGQYQVCIQPPIGWGSKVRTTHVLAGWICSAADLRTSPQLVTFRLGPQAPEVGQ